jgi:hypothetical protein
MSAFSLKDLGRVRTQATVFMLALGLTVGGAYLAWWMHAKDVSARDMASAAVSEAETRAQTAVADHANVETYRPIYFSLIKRSVIGSEQRLPWVEYFTRLAAAGVPVEFGLSIAPRRTLEDPPTTPEPLENLQFYASKFGFQSKVLHELDGLRLLAQIKQIPGATIIRSCLMKRAPSGATQARPYLLEFNCDGELITLDKPPAAPGGQ